MMTETSNNINTNTQVSSTQAQVRDLTMNYLRAYHNQTTPYMQSFMWTGGRMDMGMMVGSETYRYMSAGSAGWVLTMQYPVVPNPTYSINATYSSPSYENGIVWRGTLQNGTITETAYTFKP